MKYREYIFKINPADEELRGLLISLLAMEGFEGFTEEEDEVLAYIKPEDADLFAPEHIIATMGKMDCAVTFRLETVEERNWNELWERNYEPVYVDQEVQIRAPFHPELPGFRFNLLIEPKMSFGTGHHHTTRMMIRMILRLDMAGKSVLDMGCGTGVLAILAALRGADPVCAIDIDPWAYENTMENTALNLNRDIEVLIGGAELLNERKFDIILANINRNILLADMPVYRRTLNQDGILVVSGIMERDRSAILEKAAELELFPEFSLSGGDWISVCLAGKRD
ncbi:MAG: 50S ribosomal protein L11 methyltransferase [Bacteroidota bacterium]